MDLIVAITGAGDITYPNAEALLNNYLPDDVLVYVPSYMTSEGIKVVVQYLKDASINIERVKKPLMSSFLLGNPDSDNKALIVLGVEGSEEIIQDVMEENCPVLDLTRALFRVDGTEIALDGAESQAETLSGNPGTPMTPPNDLGLESVTEPELYMNWADRVQKEINILRKYVGMSEINWEHLANPRMPARPEIDESQIGAGETGFVTGTVPSTDEEWEATGRAKYYQNGKGKIRKAGRSKVKPGEKEVFLTEEEVASLS